MANMYKGDAKNLSYWIQDEALVDGLGVLADELVVTKLITNYTREAANQGSRYAETVSVPIRGAVSVQDKTPGTAVTPQSATNTKSTITINVHKTWDILIEDYGSLFAQNGLMSGYHKDGAMEIAEAVEAAVIALYASLSNQIGSAGGNASANLIREGRRTSRTLKFSQAAPTFAVWGVYAEEDLLAVANFVQADQSGNTDALERCYLGQKFGMTHYTSNLMPAVSGSPGAEHNLIFQRDAFGIAFVDLNLSTIPGAFTQGHLMKVMFYSDDDGVPAYYMRSIVGYDQKERGTLLTVDTIFGCNVIRDAHGIDVLT